MKSVPSSFELVLVLFLAVEVYATPKLMIFNPELTYLGASIEFTVHLLHYQPHFNNLKYIFDDGIERTEIRSSSLRVSTRRIFSSDVYRHGRHFMNVTVISFLFWEETVAENFTRFHLKSDLIGNISVYRGVQGGMIDVDEVAVGENISVVLNLFDPDNYLDDADTDYSWNVDYDRHRTLNNTLIYNFDEEGMKTLHVAATSTFKNNDFMYGTFKKVITAKVPVNNVNVVGNPFLYHGDKLNLKITCNGTPPFIYCFEIMSHNITKENFSCSHLSTFTTCHMEIIKYIQGDGRYNLGIYISNDVVEVKRVLEVMVYSVSVDPTLSTIIIPIVCSLLALIIIAAGIVYFIQHRNQLTVEVANFDFQDSDSYSEQTFFEQIFNSLSCRNCRSSRLLCQDQTENDPLL